jgi:heterodisulfide reductase subunit A
VPVCPYGAIKPVEKGLVKGVAVVPALCWGCGACAPACARQAITMLHYTDQQIRAQIEIALRDRPEEKILAFFCNWCSYVAADLAGVNRAQYSAAVRVIRVMCSGRVAPAHIYDAFNRGAGIVLVAGCPPGDCHYVSGNLHCQDRIERVKKKMVALGIAPERLRLEWLASTDGARLARVVNELAEQLTRQGKPPEPSPMLRQLASRTARLAVATAEASP